MKELPERSTAVAAGYLIATALIAIAAAAGTWALFMWLTPDLDFGLIFFVSMMVGVAVETALSCYLKRILRKQQLDEKRKQRENR